MVLIMNDNLLVSPILSSASSFVKCLPVRISALLVVVTNMLHRSLQSLTVATSYVMAAGRALIWFISMMITLQPKPLRD